jgi:hypothetical protein
MMMMMIIIMVNPLPPPLLAESYLWLVIDFKPLIPKMA